MLSKLETKFAQVWTSLNTGIRLKSQYRFHPPRRFAADFAHIESMVLIEIQGGVWMKGKSGHSSGSGITDDYEKMFIASLDGFTTFYLTGSMITESNLLAIANFIKTRTNETAHAAA